MQVSLFFPEVEVLCTLLPGFHTVLCFLFELLLYWASNFLLLPICQSEMKVVLCQTSCTSD